jgi:hypothetical protein
VFSPEVPLIVHDGELADVCQLLAELGLAFVEAPARMADVSAYYAASLVIASPPFLLERLDDTEGKHPARIVIMASEGRTVRALLTKSGVERVVRRPVHPTALRLFLLHSLYRGRDKRDNQRVSVGSEVQLRRGWRRRKLLLAEISQRDCRLVTTDFFKHPFKPNQKVFLRLPKEVTGERVLVLPSRVVRIGAVNKTDGMRDICLIFEHLDARDAGLLSKIIEVHATSPAIFDGDLSAAEPREARVVGSRPVQPEGEEATAGAGASSGTEEDAPAGNRRATPRHAFDRRVVALGEEAARVLLGRDISRRGMRVDPSPTLGVGDRLQIAIHTPERKTPLVLQAEVARDDGERGLLLQFVELAADADSYLNQLIQPLPELAEPSRADDAEPQMVVSEILEHRAAAS